MKNKSQMTFLDHAALTLLAAYHQNSTIQMKEPGDFVKMAVREAGLLCNLLLEFEKKLYE